MQKYLVGEVPRDRLVEPGEHLVGGRAGGHQGAGQGLDHPGEQGRVDAVPRDVGHEHAEPAAVEPREVVDVAPQGVGRLVADGQLEHPARLGRTGHQRPLDLAGQIELEVQLRLGGLELPVPLGQHAPEVGDPELGADPGEEFLDLLGRLGLLQVVVGAGVEADDLALGRPQGRQHHHGDRPQLGVGLERLTEPGPVEHGHLVVAEDQLGGRLAGLDQAVAAVDGGRDLVALVLEQGGDHPPHRGAVLDQQESPRHLRRPYPGNTGAGRCRVPADGGAGRSRAARRVRDIFRPRPAEHKHPGDRPRTAFPGRRFLVGSGSTHLNA